MVVAKLLLGQFSGANDFMVLVCFLMLYISCRNWLLLSRDEIDDKILDALVFTIVIFIGFFIYNSILAYGITDIFFPNNSIFGILLAAQLILASFLYFIKFCLTKQAFFQPITFLRSLALLGGFILLILLNGRAAWVGLVTAIIYLMAVYTKNKIRKRLFLLMGALIILLSVFILALYKRDSTAGRLLIYKVSFQMFKENWWAGIGYGQFKVKYNEYQARYFLQNNIDGREAQLADNTFFAFNDLFQFLIENGVICSLFVVAIFWGLIFRIRKTTCSDEKRHLCNGSTASLICILTASLFSYPLQIIPIVIHFICCLVIINSLGQKSRKITRIDSVNGSILRYGTMGLSLLLFIYYSFCLNYQSKSSKASKVSISGYKKQSMDIYEELSHSFINDAITSYAYARELYNRNRLVDAKNVLDKTKTLYCINDLYRLKAKIDEELYNFQEAEANYKTALYMVPNRIRSRYDLFEFYLRRKDTLHAIYWAKSIANMPIKIPSEITENFQGQAKKLLHELSR